MHLEQNPFFRKTITPWYDANPACWIMIGAMIPVFFYWPWPAWPWHGQIRNWLNMSGFPPHWQGCRFFWP
jgi:hypothetical protein